MTDYRPKALRSGFEPSPDDLAYARAFSYLVQMTKHIKNSEAAVLRLSTCRNAFLTVNAVFVDIAECVGYADEPSRIAKALFLAAKNRTAELKLVLDEVGERLGQVDLKYGVWQNRFQIDDAIEVARCACDPLIADELRPILRNVRTSISDASSADQWDGKWYAWSSDEPTIARDRLQRLIQVRERLAALCEVLKAIRIYIDVVPLSGAGLFTQPADADWNLFGSTCLRQGDLWDLASGTGHASEFGSELDLMPVSEVISECHSNSDRCEAVRAILGRLDRVTAAIRMYLATFFQENASRRRMPPPFVVDLASCRSPADEEQSPRVQILQRDFGSESPKVIHLAFLKGSLPDGFIDKDGRYAQPEDAVLHLGTLVERAIDSCEGPTPTALILPEMFLPSATLQQLTAAARRRRVVLIAGIEHPGADSNDPENSVVIQLPCHQSPIKQLKSRNSVLEQRFKCRTPFLRVLYGTEIGSFAVIVCSDYMQLDIMTALHQVRQPIDLLFVCSQNPHPDIFETFAYTDSVRLYCHVAIANTYRPVASTTPSLNALVCSPLRDVAKRSRTPMSQKEITHGPEFRFHIENYELSVDDIRAGRSLERQPTGYVACPQCRQAPIRIVEAPSG